MDLLKEVLYTHNFKSHFSPPFNRYNNRLTVHVCTIAKGSTVYFTEASVSNQNLVEPDRCVEELRSRVTSVVPQYPAKLLLLKLQSCAHAHKVRKK